MVAFPLPALGQTPSPDFLFRSPRGSFGIHGGYAVPIAGGDVFGDTFDWLTLGRSDLSSATLGADLAVVLSERLDLALDLGYASRTTRSEFREWVDTDDQPIEQETYFRRIPLTANVRWYFRDRGRSIGRFVWVPSKWSPYIGAGGGWVWYLFEQEGDFVDFETLEIFFDRFRASGGTGTLHAFAGAELSLNHRFLLRGEGRYSWAGADPGGDWFGYDTIDLSGFQVTIGIVVRGS